MVTPRVAMMESGAMESVEVGVAEAEATPSALLERAVAGGEVIITRDGAPFARAVPIDPGPINRQPGVLRWAPGAYDPAVLAPMTDDEMAAENWP